MNSCIRNANRLTRFLFVTLICVSMAGAILLPGSIPVHYNWNGQPDRWGSPATLLILPFINFFVLGILWAAEKAHPSLMNFPGPRTPENVARQVGNIQLMSASMRVFLTGLFLSIQSQSIWANFYNQNQLIGWTMPVLIISLFLLTGFFVWRAYKLVPRQ